MAAAFAAVAIVCCVNASAEPIWSGPDSARYILFSGTDIWGNGSFTHGGLLWAPGGVDRDGFVLKTLLSGGVYHYRSGALGNAEVTGTEFVAQVLPGWRFKRGTFEVRIFTGLDLQDHHLSPFDPSSRLHGGSVGARTSIDAWYEPTPFTMIAADGSVSTIVDSYSARIAFGWKMFNQFYMGPEAQTFASDGYRQVRVGVHFTAFKTGVAEWSAAAGWADDSDHRTGAYFRLGVSARR